MVGNEQGFFRCLTKEKLTTILHKFNSVFAWAVLVGFICGLVGTGFWAAVHQAMQARAQLNQSLSAIPVLNWLVPILASAIMVQLAFMLMRRYAPEVSGSGIPQIEGNLGHLLPLRWERVLPIKFVTGVLSLGGGMLLGLEGPTIQIGGSIGRMVSQWGEEAKKHRKTLVAAGAGAGLTTAFNAPLAGILFVVEEMRPHFDYSVSSYRAVMIASTVAALTTRLLRGQDSALQITVFDAPPLDSLWIFALLGISLGAIACLFNWLLIKTLDGFKSFGRLPTRWIGLGIGAFIGYLGWFHSPLIGGGERLIIWGFNQQQPTTVLLVVFLLRFGLTILCYGSGAPGGIFAPMLAIATLFSLIVARTAYAWFPLEIPEPAVLTVAGMGALVAATVRAPLTAIILTIEMTANYSLILPLLVTCLAAAITADGLGGKPIYRVLLKRLLKQNQQEEILAAIEESEKGRSSEN